MKLKRLPNVIKEMRPHHKWLIFALVGVIILSTAFNVLFGLDFGLSNRQSCPTVTPVPTVTTKPPANNTTKPTATPTPPTTKYTILFFTQPNCPYCDAQSPKVCAWAESHTSRMTLQKVDLYQDNTLPAKYGVRSTPTTIIIDSSGKALKTWVGEFDTAEMTTWLSTH